MTEACGVVEEQGENRAEKRRWEGKGKGKE